MDITLDYAIAAGGVFALLFLTNLVRLARPLLQRISREASKHLYYTYLVGRHRYLGPWILADALMLVVYVASNVFCISFRAASTAEVGERAGKMAMVNIVPLFAGPYHSSLADALGVRLTSARLVHRSAGTMTAALGLVHLLFSIAAAPAFDLGIAKNLFAVTVSVRSPLLCPADVA
jgi:hypothetical protein